MPRELGKQQNTVAELTKVATATDAGAFDSAESGLPMTPINNDTHTVRQQAEAGFSSASAQSPFVPDVQVSPPPSVNKGTEVRPASKFDLENLNESNIMDMPFIQAKGFDIAAMLQVKAKDPAIRFRWVNFKNNEGGNYQMFKSIGFVNAVVEDVDLQTTPLSEYIVHEDGAIKYFDVILMKINVMRLMQAYKANIQKSLTMVGRWSENAKREAERTFRRDVSPDMLELLKQKGLQVEFFEPKNKEPNNPIA